MRKLIIKHFALDYIAIIFGQRTNWVRAANIIFPLFCINGVYSIKTETYPLETTIGIILLALLVIALFFGFVYFKLYPVKWEELDRMQKWQYGHAASTGELSPAVKLSREQLNYFNVIDEYYTDLFKRTKNWKVGTLLVNSLSAIISVLIILV